MARRETGERPGLPKLAKLANPVGADAIQAPDACAQARPESRSLFTILLYYSLSWPCHRSYYTPSKTSSFRPKTLSGLCLHVSASSLQRSRLMGGHVSYMLRFGSYTLCLQYMLIFCT